MPLEVTFAETVEAGMQYCPSSWCVSVHERSVCCGYLRKKDAELVMEALNGTGIDWDAGLEEARAAVVARFGSNDEMRLWANSHLQW